MPNSDCDLILRPVDGSNWRGVARLAVKEEQRGFVAQPLHYLALCAYGGVWHPLAVQRPPDGEVLGFLMWALDPADGACWLGGILIDREQQGRGYGRRAIRAALELLSTQHGFRRFALSYSPENPAKRLYQALGFVETGEWEDDEAVARLEL